MKVITFVTSDGGAYKFYKESFNRNRQSGSGDEFVTLGWGDTWHSFGDRLMKYHKYVSQLSQSGKGDEICLITDGYDVILTGSLAELKAKFLESNSNILISTERHNFGASIFNHMLMGAPIDGVAICAGAYMGYAKDLASMLSDITSDVRCASKHSDDQRLLSEWVHQNKSKVKLDSKWNIFATWANGNTFDSETAFTFEKEKGTLKFTDDDGTRPIYVLHRPFANNMAATIKQLGYKMTVADEKSVMPSSDYLKKFYTHHYHNWCERVDWVQFLCILIVIIFIVVWSVIKIKTAIKRKRT